MALRTTEILLWSIGAPDGRSRDLLDNYKAPDLPGEVVWRVGLGTPQRWPLYHPSEADPDAGYRARPYRIEFKLEHDPAGAYELRVHYLEIAPRLPHLEIRINGTTGRAFLRPHPSTSGEIRLHAGLHTTIYAEGVMEVVIPATLLRRGINTLELICRDDGEVVRIINPEAIKRLDRMANGAGIIYQYLTFSQIEDTPETQVRQVELKPSVLYTRDDHGTLLAHGDLYLELTGLAEDIQLTLELRDDVSEQSLELSSPGAAFGHLSFPFTFFDGENPVAYRLTGTVDGERLEQHGTLRRHRKWKVFVSAHAHTDIGYTHRQWEVAERLSRNLDVALVWLEGEREAFAYHLDAAWVLETFLATRDAGTRSRLLEEIAAGRVGLVSNYVDLLTQFAALEDLIRNGEYTDGFLRPQGLKAELAAVVDVGSISGSVPAVLEGSGVKYLVHADNQDRGPFRLNGGLHRLSPFYWEGTTGGRVLCWLAKMYCELRKVCGSPPTPSAAERGLGMWLEEYDHDDYAPDAVLLYGQEADNTDLDPQPVEFVRAWNATYAYPQLITADPAAFFRYVEEHFASQLATVRGDGGAYWEDGAGSSIAESMLARQVQADLPAAEILSALATVHQPGHAYPLGQFDDAWRELLLFDEHTWGAFLSCTDPHALLAQDQWRVKEGMIRAAHNWSTRLLHAAATRHSLSWNTTGREVAVYNPHSWPVSGSITVEIGAGETVLDATGSPVPLRHVRATATQAVVELWVAALEGLSYRRFRLEPGEHKAATVQALALKRDRVVLENAYYRLTVDPAQGCVTSLIDKGLQRELVEVEAPFGLGQLLYARGGEGTRLVSNQADLPDGNPSVTGDLTVTSLTREAFGYGERLVVTGRAPWGEVEITWTLLDTAKRIDLHYRLLKQATRAKEALYVAFPFGLPDARVLSDSQLGWVDWARGMLPGGCKEWLPLQTGVRFEGAKAQVFLASPDIPLFCIGDINRGRWPKEWPLAGGRIFSYVLNNYWHTNYKAEQGGEIAFQYSLTSGVEISPSDAYRLGREARRPLYAQRMSYQAFREPHAPYLEPAGGTLARLESDRDHIVLSTLKGARWADGLIVRLQEISGRNGTAVITLPERRIAQAWQTDLLERDLHALAVSPDGELHVEVPAWGLATVRLVLAEREQA